MKPAITLIELLVVIALVGIIAGTGWPALDRMELQTRAS